MTSSCKTKFRKVLYEKQDYPDNYVDENFLNDLRKNVNFKPYCISSSIIATGVVTEALCKIVILWLLFLYMISNQSSFTTLVIVDSSVIFACGIAYCLFNRLRLQHVFENEGFLYITLYGCVSFGLSPFVKTLTETISSDTVYALAVAGNVLHLLTNDYGLSFAIVSRSLSVNSIIFTVVCLASRLHDSHSAFLFMMLSAEISVFLPLILQNVSLYFRAVVTLTLVIVSAVALTFASSTMAILYLCSVVFINIFCPILFVYFQKYKENIYGPWDEAVLTQ